MEGGLQASSCLDVLEVPAEENMDVPVDQVGEGQQYDSGADESQDHPALSLLWDHQRALQHYLQTWSSQQESLLHQLTGLVERDIDAAAGSFTRPPQGQSRNADNVLFGKTPFKSERETNESPVIDGESNCFRRPSQSTLDLRVPPRQPLFKRMFSAISSASHLRVGEPNVGALRDRGFRYVLERVEKSTVFESLCATVIFGNVIFFAVDADRQIHEAAEHSTVHSNELVEMMFSVFYTCELLLRIIVKRMDFVCGRDRTWNIFDTVLVLSAVQGHVASFLDLGSGEQNLSYLRVVRLTKTLKLLRVIRLLRGFRELRLVLNSLLGSMHSMIWSVVLCATIMFIFGICFVQASAQHLANEQMSQEERQSMIFHWGSVLGAMDSLWMAVTGGVDWNEPAHPLRLAGWHYYLMFIFYIGLFLFVVANSITSLFLDSAMQYAERDHHQIIQDQLRRKREYMNKVMSIYSQMDKDNSGDVTYEEFCTLMSDPQMMAFAASLDIDTSDLQQFFSILSNNGQCAVDMETFVIGCIKLRGSARSMDVIDLVLSHKKSVANHERFSQYCEQQFRILEERLGLAAASHRPGVPSKGPSRCNTAMATQTYDGIKSL